MERKYIIVRLDDNNYWGFGYWETDVKLAQLFDEPEFPKRRIAEGDLIEKGEISDLFMKGKVFEVREIYINKNYREL